MSCGGKTPPDGGNSAQELTQAPQSVTSQELTEDEVKFISMEKAYYSKYVELAEKYGTYSLYDYYSVKGYYSEHSYLGGVCIVSLMDFNRDGIQDLFIAYSNGRMNKITNDSFNLEIYDLPAKDTYEFEIWTYKDGGLSLILHESSVSSCYTYPNDKSDFFLKYYQNFITVYENKNGLPVIQVYDESGEERIYTNIYYSDGQIVRDKLIYNGYTLKMNGMEVTEAAWSENVAGYNKILLCSLLADSHSSSSYLLDGYNIDYNNTLLQTERVIRYLSEEDSEPVMSEFYAKEGEYVSLYLQETERANRNRLSPEFIENHYMNLYDINQDEIPELILYEGSSGAGTHYHFYTIKNGALTDCGLYGRTTLYVNDEGGLIAYFGRMNNYQIDKIEMQEDAIIITDIAGGHIQDSYPELEEFGYNNYRPLSFCPPAIPLAIYTYDYEL